MTLKSSLLLLVTAFILILSGCKSTEQDQPNILWITCEDISPHLGCYGDEYAYTPNLDRLAAAGVRYDNAFAPAPLCTPARSSLIAGVYASSMGTQHLRGPAPLSEKIKCYSEYLREAGYYCTNNVKEDYNFDTPETAWDESSNTAHWRGRAEGQPFFSIFNFTLTHQSQTRYLLDKLNETNDTLAPEERHDPADAPLPPYYPDTEIVRQNVAALHTQITLLDKKVKELLDQLEEDGLAESTIVFFYSDHGDGLPRGKRWIHVTGTRVPMIVYFPEKYRRFSPGDPGSVISDLINFVDLPPTLLSLVGLEIPDYMQGTAFLGEQAGEKHEYIFAIRDRVDEVLEFTRAVRDEQYCYIRNFYPHRPRMQRSFYSERTPIRQEIRRLHAEGQLEGEQQWLMMPTKPAEELYDRKADPLEINNLAGDPEYKELLEEMKGRLFDWMVETKDLSLLPEAEMHRRAAYGSPYDMGRDPDAYPIEEILQTADMVGRGVSYIDELGAALDKPDPAIRYWGAVGLAALGEEARPARDVLVTALNDKTPAVRIAAAEALVNLGNTDEAMKVLVDELSNEDHLVKMLAVETLVALGEKSKPAAPHLEKLVTDSEEWGNIGWYMREASTWLLGILSEE